MKEPTDYQRFNLNDEVPDEPSECEYCGEDLYSEPHEMCETNYLLREIINEIRCLNG